MRPTLDKMSYEVEFETVPQLPIFGVTLKECHYAQLLTAAIIEGIIVKPGKYKLCYDPADPEHYDVFICTD